LVPEMTEEVSEALRFPQAFGAYLQFRDYMKPTEQYAWPA